MARPHGGNAVIQARLRAQPPLTPADAHFVAGLIDAEGCFQIRPVNGGQRWECSLKVAVRDDDAALLRDVHRTTGLGGVTERKTSGTSRPQIQWHVESRLEAFRLAELLMRYPLRGRKRLEAQVWAEAVFALAEAANPPPLPRLATEIRRLRRYVNPPHDIPAAPLDDGWIPYLGGFFTGDGHLSLAGGRCRAVVKLRDDDRPLLESMAATTGLGRIYSVPSRGRSKPTAAWVVSRQDELAELVDILDKAGLRGRKRREFEIWRPAALESAAAARADRRRRDPQVVTAAAQALSDFRVYRADTSAEVREDATDIAKRVYIDILRRVAASTQGHVTGKAYATLRRDNPSWPTRTTIAVTFGSWAGALQAAGLEDRCSARARARAAHEPRQYTAHEGDTRWAARQRVLAAVAGLMAQDPAHTPTVDRYLSHRAARDPTLPSLSRLYNLFPVGWRGVLVEARSVVQTSPPEA